MITPLTLLKNKAYFDLQPLYSSIELSYNCNLHCVFCYNPVQRKGQARLNPPPEPVEPPLSYEEIVALLDDFKALGALYLTLTGGEAMIHPRFWDIVAEVKKRAFALRIFTNGMTINEQVADRLAQAKPYCMEVSIHGASDASAEALTQVPGSHGRLLKALTLLKERSMRVFLKCVVTRLNEGELKAIQAIGDELGFPVYFDPVLTISDDGESYPMDLQASDDAIRWLYRTDGLNIGNSPFERKVGELNCSLAMGAVHVDPFGNVQPCVQWKKKAGNIRRQSLAEIWKNSVVMEEARKVNMQMTALISKMTEDHETCQHCPGLSLLRYDDAYRLEEQYLRVARIRREVMGTEQEQVLTEA